MYFFGRVTGGATEGFVDVINACVQVGDDNRKGNRGQRDEGGAEGQQEDEQDKQAARGALTNLLQEVGAVDRRIDYVKTNPLTANLLEGNVRTATELEALKMIQYPEPAAPEYEFKSYDTGNKKGFLIWDKNTGNIIYERSGGAIDASSGKSMEQFAWEKFQDLRKDFLADQFKQVEDEQLKDMKATDILLMAVSQGIDPIKNFEELYTKVNKRSLTAEELQKARIAFDKAYSDAQDDAEISALNQLKESEFLWEYLSPTLRNKWIDPKERIKERERSNKK